MNLGDISSIYKSFELIHLDTVPLNMLSDTDVDECKHKNGGCQDICVNTLGGYQCACSDPGFRIARDKHHCVGMLFSVQSLQIPGI